MREKKGKIWRRRLKGREWYGKDKGEIEKKTIVLTLKY